MDLNKILNQWEEMGKNFKSIFASNPAYDKETAFIHHHLEEKKLLNNLELNNLKDKKIIDIGAGTGRFSITFSRFSNYVLATEPVDSLFNILKNLGLKHNFKFEKETLHQSLDRKEKWDIIFISGVLLFFEDNEVKEILEKIKEKLNDNGLLIIRDYISMNNLYGDWKIRNYKKWKYLFNRSFLLKRKFPTRKILFFFNLSKIIKFPIHKRIYQYYIKNPKRINKTLSASPIIDLITFYLFKKPKMHFFILEKK